MQEAELLAHTTRLLWATFVLAGLFGALARHSNFCTMGAVADVVNMGDWQRMRLWVLAMAVAVLGFNAMVALGWVQAAQSIYAGPRLAWLSLLLGGGMFGFGMVLASGCGTRNLVRLGGGNLKALVVLGVMGLCALATLRGLAAVWRVRALDAVALELPRGQDLPTLAAPWLGLAVPQAAAVLGLGVAALALAWVLRRPEGREPGLWLGGVGIGALVVAVWWLSGRYGFVPEHPQTLEPTFLATSSRRMESLSLVAPLGYALDALLYFSDGSKGLTLGITSVLGIVAGSAAVALTTRSFRWEGFAGVQDMAHHLAGAALMGVGGVTALGCTVGQGLSGISTLSLGSALALAAIVAGGVAGMRYLAWRLERAA